MVRTLILAGLVLSASATHAAAQSWDGIFDSDILGTLSVNPYATPAPVVSPYTIYTPQPLSWPGSEPTIVARDGTYLGKLSTNRFDPESVSNQFGRYGSKFSPDSINNKFGQYGNPFSAQSPYNPYATQAPVLVAPNPYVIIPPNPYVRRR